jgi:lysophospholipase L1-like esterase
MKRTAITSSGILLALTLFCTESVWAAAQSSIPEEIEWTWEVRPAHPNPALPNVLLIGDSITRAYYSTVVEKLATKANVFLFGTSASIGDPRLIAQIREFFAMQRVSFRVIHFNNGMHGWAYSESEYGAGFPVLVRTLKAESRGAQLIWASVTQVKGDYPPGPTNSRIDARNAIAKEWADKEHIPIDDQHALMSNHGEEYEDMVHFNANGSAVQGEQASMQIAALLFSK